MSEPKDTSKDPREGQYSVPRLPHFPVRLGGGEINLPDVKPGWQTSEAHITAAVVFIAAALSAFGYHVTPEHLANSWDAITHLIAIVGPLLSVIPIARKYITARTRVKTAEALVSAANSPGAVNNPAMMGLLGGGIAGAILGGSPKDPSTYINLGRTVGTSGVIGGKAGDIVGQILGGGQQASARSTRFDDDALTSLFGNIVERLARVESKLN